jgi:hypothetical protein
MARDIQSEVVAQVEALGAQAPEAVSVLVVGTSDLAVAAQVGPMLAGRLYPERSFGAALNVELAELGIIVDVEVVGRPRSAVRLGQGAGSQA